MLFHKKNKIVEELLSPLAGEGVLGLLKRLMNKKINHTDLFRSLLV